MADDEDAQRRGPKPRSVMIAWIIGVVVIAGITWQIPGPTSLDDPDLAHQQGGWTANAGSWISGAVHPSDLQGLGLPDDLIGTSRFMIAFDRTLPDADTLAAHQATMEPGVPVVVVVNDLEGKTPPAGTTVVEDPDATIANTVGIRRPVDGGYPIGITIVDSSGQTRYTTLDKGWTTNTFECNLVLQDVA